MIAVNIFHDLHYDQELRMGFSYQVLPYITIRAGIEDQFDLYCFGLGLDINWILMDYSIRTHPVLGISHIATLSFVL